MRFGIVCRALASAAFALCLPLAASAQNYPTKPVTLVVTVPAGGSIDAVARFLAADLGAALGKPVVVVNQGGAGGNIAAQSVASAPADGHTLLITSSSTLVLNPFVYKTVSFDPVKSFVPIGIPAQQNLILTVPERLHISKLHELVSLLKSKPGGLNYASAGSGTVPHLASVLFGEVTKTSALHVPYRGIAPALNALLTGEVDFMFDSASTISQIQAGKIKALAVIGPKRLAALPNVATFRELGLPDMETARGWYGIFAPAGTPPDIVHRLNREMVRIMNQPAIVEKIKAIGLENTTSTPEQLDAILREDIKRFGPIVKRSGMTVD